MSEKVMTELTPALSSKPKKSSARHIYLAVPAFNAFRHASRECLPGRLTLSSIVSMPLFSEPCHVTFLRSFASKNDDNSVRTLLKYEHSVYLSAFDSSIL